jgi:hypothetical protein
VHTRLTIVTIVAIAWTSSGEVIENPCRAADPIQQQAAPTKGADENAPAKKAPGGGTAHEKVRDRGKGAKKKADRDKTPKKTQEEDTGLSMEPGIVCKSIDGYENYEPLPDAAQTSEEKLLVYVRPLGFKTEKVDGAYEGHLAADFEIRKRGAKAILLQKKKMLEYKPRAERPPQFIYLKNIVSLKGLAPGDYDLTIILRDEIAKGAATSQVIKFKVIPPQDPGKKNDPAKSQPEE